MKIMKGDRSGNVEPRSLDNISGKAYESMVARRSRNYKDINKALDIVKKFIMKHNFIIYGGMAIDAAARLKGEFLYNDEDDVIPDYDFYVNNLPEQAYDLADILFKEGFSNVRVIGAAHVTTMRVGLDNDWVADMSYIPENIYKTLPTITYQRFRFIHPHFQRIDFHVSLSEPLRDPPMEVVFHRFNKDIKRMKMMDRLYPVDLESIGHKQTEKNKTMRSKKIHPKMQQIKYLKLKDAIHVGFASYAMMYYSLQTFLENVTEEMLKGEFKPTIANAQKKFKKLIKASISVEKGNLMIDIPKGQPIALYSDAFDKLIPKIKKELSSKGKKSTTYRKYYNNYMDKSRPRTVEWGDSMVYQILDNRRSLKTYTPINIDGTEIRVVSPQNTLLYFLQRYYEKNDWVSLSYYISTMRLIEITEDVLLEFKDENISIMMDALPMFIGRHFYGKYNYSDSYLIGKEYMDYALDSVPPNEREVLRPKSYQPAQMKRPRKIDPTDMKIYQIDGKVTSTFKEV